MLKDVSKAAAAAALLLIGVSPASAQLKAPPVFQCSLPPSASKPPEKVKNPTAEDERPAAYMTRANTVCVDHFAMKPAGRPLVVQVGDGEEFFVIVGNTDTTQFAYALTAIPDQEVPSTPSGATGAGRPATRFGDTTLQMRHSKLFQRYRLEIGLRADLAPKPALPKDAAGAVDRGKTAAPMLYPGVFDIWVRTAPGIEVSFSGGFAFSGLRSPRFHLKTDTKGTETQDDDDQTVEEDENARDDFRPDTIAVVNVNHPGKLAGVGLSFGVGLNNDADPRYFLGVSKSIGRHALLFGGVAGGKIDRLPTGQELKKAALNGANTLANLPTRFATSWFVGISFSFVSGAEDKFKGAFSTSQKTAEPEAGEQEESQPDPKAATPADFAGSYASKDGATAVVKAQDAGLAVTIGGDTFVLAHDAGGTYVSDDKKQTCQFKRGAETVSVVCKGAKAFEGERAK